MKETHESCGMINICKFSSNKSTFFGSDITHQGGISITISTARKNRHLSKDWYHMDRELIEIEMSHSQYVDAITSGMNTSGVPCTIKRVNGKIIERINHVIDKKDVFSSEMKKTQDAYKIKIDDIIANLEGSIGKRKKADIVRSLITLKTHIESNNTFVLNQFDRAMEKTVTEAKQSISMFIENKINTLGIEKAKEELSKTLPEIGR